KDEILGFAAERGGSFWIIVVGGYLGALLTGIYAFRIIFRVFFGEPCPEARSLEGGEPYHADPVNPATGEKEDTDVGFPGHHWIAERAWPMAAAMSVLGVLSVVGGYVQVPGVDELITELLVPTLEDSPFEAIHEPTSSAWIGLGVGGVISIIGIGIAYYLYVANPGTTARLIARARALHAFFVNKWYFDELQDALVYRPVIGFGRFANVVFERYVVQGLVAGAVGLVRGFNVVVRGAQTGFVRGYATLLVGGFAALGLYFLLASS
ncbi:MAG TPA: NADH-quinone oxidoreductase subunit L, partial [Solirubrobacterales bacterium]|nr:NADH-quinone oxidoreductase subunit L [Solirubrobacterales bacterium]